MLGVLPVTGLLITIILNLIAGPGYTTSVNQGSMVVYFMGAVFWTVCAIATGVYMYSKCNSMNTKKFIPGVLSVLFGAALPWIIGMQL